MKNLLIYINPSYKFDKIHELMAEAQIDNNLQFWKPQDILLVTNFHYKYHGIRSMIVDKDIWTPIKYAEIYNNVWRFTKFFMLVYLLEHGVINELTWVHDFDSFQLTDLDPPPLDRDLGLVEYGFRSKINLGNTFFKPTALDIFQLLTKSMLEWKLNEEETLVRLQATNINNINSRFRKLNITYNIGSRQVNRNVNFAEKPLKIAHFPPWRPEKMQDFKPHIPEKLYNLLYEKFTNLYQSDTGL